MPDRIVRAATTRAAALLGLVLCAGLAGCSSTSDQTFAFFADPGQYQYHNCEQLAGAATKVGTRHKELQQLIDKAEQGVGGAIVSTAVYRGEHRSTGEELAVIEREQRAKNCLTASTWRSNTIIR
jgi:hypothetical protein